MLSLVSTIARRDVAGMSVQNGRAVDVFTSFIFRMLPLPTHRALISMNPLANNEILQGIFLIYVCSKADTMSIVRLLRFGPSKTMPHT
jgi:hypothetical protein